MRGRKIISLILTIATLIFMIACLLFYNTSRSYKAEKGIEEALKAYSASMEEAEIKVLTKEINDAVEKKLSEMNTQDLTQEDLKELLETVIRELEVHTVEYRDRDITLEEINLIANEVIKKIIEQNIIPSNEDELAKLEAYKLQLDQLTNIQQDFYSKLIRTENTITELQKRISELEKELDSDKIGQLEKTVNKQIEELKKADSQLNEKNAALEKIISELEKKIAGYEEKLANLEGNILFYEYNQDTQTLNVYGKKGE